MDKKLYKINLLTAAFIVVVLFMSFFFSATAFMKMDFNLYDNKIRALVSEQKDEIESGNYETWEYPYMVIGLDGVVIYSEEPFEEKVGEILNVEEMVQFDHSFYVQNQNLMKESFLLLKDGNTVGFAVFLIPRSVILMNTRQEQFMSVFLFIIIGIIVSVCILVIRVVYCNKCILNPLREISVSTRGIIAGNYDLEVVRVFESKVRENEVGELTYSFELMRDELKEKQVREEKLKKSQQELISCISHDLKTPISTIKAYSEGLRDHIAKNRQKQEEFIAIIINKTDLLIGMIEELLDYSNTQLKQLDISRKEVYFLGYFKPLMKELKTYVDQKGVEFSYEINMPDILVNIDIKRISQVMYNLVENSMKYMGTKEGKIIVTVERENLLLVVRVKDNGAGIGADDIPYVFDKFYRAEKSRNSSVPGSGLGLSICKYIINEHDGDIFCKSKQNKGCEIWFSLSLEK